MYQTSIRSMEGITKPKSVELTAQVMDDFSGLFLDESSKRSHERSKQDGEFLASQIHKGMQEGGGELIWRFDSKARDLNPAVDFEVVSAAARASSANCTPIYPGYDSGKMNSSSETASSHPIAAIIRRNPTSLAEDGEGPVDVRLAVVGNVDSGKSTLVGVLTSGVLDNGRGLARSKVFRHRHEIETGRTSSITHQILGLDEYGKFVGGGSRENDWAEIVSSSAKVLTFVDLAGHERYIKTTVSGMTGCLPDYALVVVGSNHGVLRMMKEHLSVAVALKLPLIFAVTKLDMCPPNILKQTLADIGKLLKSPAVSKIPVIVRSNADVLLAAQSMANDARIAPIFLISSVTGEGVDPLRLFLNIAPPQKTMEKESSASAAAFHVDDTFYVAGVGAVVGGTMLRGSLALRDSLVIGPDSRGNFVPVQIRSIHNKRIVVSRVAAGQSATLALKKLKRNQIRKGMVIAKLSMQPKACMRFVAEVVILHHPTTIGLNYQPIVHCLTVRQACKVVAVDGESGLLRSGDRAHVTFQFMYRPEYLVFGARIIFREGRTKGIGKICGLHFTDGTFSEAQTGSAASSAPRIPRASVTDTHD